MLLCPLRSTGRIRRESFLSNSESRLKVFGPKVQYFEQTLNRNRLIGLRHALHRFTELFIRFTLSFETGIDWRMIRGGQSIKWVKSAKVLTSGRAHVGSVRLPLCCQRCFGTKLSEIWVLPSFVGKSFVSGCLCSLSVAKRWPLSEFRSPVVCSPPSSCFTLSLYFLFFSSRLVFYNFPFPWFSSDLYLIMSPIICIKSLSIKV